MTEEKKYVVGVDIGGQTSKIGVVDLHGNVLTNRVIRTDIYGADAKMYVDALADAVLKCIVDSGTFGKIRGIGVGAPNGNYYTGQISFAPNLAWASNGTVELVKMLSEATGGLPVALTNDANAAAMGEMAYGAARGTKNFIMITLGTGVGSGIVIDGKMVYGGDGFAGELGHTCAIRDGRQCGCGKKGCLEAYCSAIGVERTAREWLENTSEHSILRQVEKVTAKEVSMAAAQGDALALRVFEYTGTILGRSLADFVAFSAPEAIVFFGGLTKGKQYFHDAMVKAMEAELLPIWKGKVKILYSMLKESDAAILGASALAWDL